MKTADSPEQFFTKKETKWGDTYLTSKIIKNVLYKEFDFRFSPVSVNGNFYIFEGMYWRQVGKDEIEAWAIKSLEGPDSQCEHLLVTAQINLAVKYIIAKIPESLEPVHKGNNLGVTDGYMPFEDGIYNISKKELSKHSHLFGFEKGLSMSAPSDDETPVFDQFMDEICTDRGEVDVAKRQQLLEVLGICASGVDNKKAPYIFCLTGGGGNGKGVFVSVVNSLTEGKSSIVSVRDLDSGNSTHSLKGSFVNVMEEMDASLNRNSWGTLKRLSSGDVFTVKKKYANDEFIYPTAKVLMTCNKLPSLSEENSAIKRRLRVFQFKNSFVGREDRFIESRLRKEVSGIFYKALEAYRAFQKRGYRFDEALSVEQASESHQATGREPYKMFFDECLQLSPATNAHVSKEFLSKTYNAWVKETLGSSGPQEKIIKQAHNLKEYMQEQAVKDGSMPDVWEYNRPRKGDGPLRRRDICGKKKLAGLFCVRLSTDGVRLLNESYRRCGLALPDIPRQSAPAESETAGRDNVVKIRV